MISWEQWCSNPYLAWGLGTYISVNLGAWLTICVLEWYIRQPFADKHFVTWKSKEIPDRRAGIRKTQKLIPLRKQIFGAMATTMGPTAGIGLFLVVNLLKRFMPTSATSPVLPSLPEMIGQFILMELVGDLGLYWGHRIQHEIPFLWRHCHQEHHKLETSTPVSTLYIEGSDATLQASLPLFLAVLVVRAHFVVFYAYAFARLAENVLNHSGLQGSVFDLIFLKFTWLGRASVSHHDSHHKFGGRPGKVMNIGENFWLWDYAFGTLANHSSQLKNPAR
jgi:sterol desaturase/sphingolipid hydroxylase (fatty acid hydroxylase superfamily)